MIPQNIPGAQDREQQHLFEDLDRPMIYASFLRRFAALFIDGIILGIGNEILLSILGFRLLQEDPEPMANLITTVTGWLYFALQESGKGRATLGKRALGIQVCDLNGGQINFAQATGRYFAKILSTIILVIGWLMMLWDSRKQTLHDRLANTLVVKDPPPYLG